MRTFVVTSKHDRIDFPDQPDITMEFYKANDLVDLFNIINKKYGEDTIIYDEGTEEEMLSQIYESNGDGDWRWIIGEIEILTLPYPKLKTKIILD